MVLWMMLKRGWMQSAAVWRMVQESLPQPQIQLIQLQRQAADKREIYRLLKKNSFYSGTGTERILFDYEKLIFKRLAHGIVFAYNKNMERTGKGNQVKYLDRCYIRKCRLSAVRLSARSKCLWISKETIRLVFGMAAFVLVIWMLSINRHLRREFRRLVQVQVWQEQIQTDSCHTFSVPGEVGEGTAVKEGVSLLFDEKAIQIFRIKESSQTVDD